MVFSLLSLCSRFCVEIVTSLQSFIAYVLVPWKMTNHKDACYRKQKERSKTLELLEGRA